MNNKIWCLVENYPRSEDLSEGFFVHNRNKYYQDNGAKVTVVNFSTKESYSFDKIEVLTLKEFIDKKKEWKNSILICHAPNVRHHYLFLKKYKQEFISIILFFHGHEILKINEVYSAPYSYEKKNLFIRCMQDLYDTFKTRIWGYFIRKNIKHLFLFFVSDWMKLQFIKFTGLSDNELKQHCSVTYNAVGKVFEESVYDFNSPKQYDFITIRGNLDNSKYGIDIVNKLAILNPNKKFLLIGKGKFFLHVKKADNLEWIDGVLEHSSIMQYLNKARIALMPTRTDAQGVMACEIATTGMPLITSNIDVCHEIFDEFENVKYIDNNFLTPFDECFLMFLRKVGNRKYTSGYTNKQEYSIILRIGKKCSIGE